MTNDLFYEFTIDEQLNTIIVKREFLASIRLVWLAWTTAEILDQWWAPEGWKSQTKNMEFKVGGHRHYQMTGPGDEVFWGLTTYTSINQHIDFAGNELFADENAIVNQEYPQSTFKIMFSEEGNKTLIHHQTTYASMDELKSSLSFGFEQGTIGAYKRLDEYLAMHRT